MNILVWVAAVLVVLWLIGWVGLHILGAFIHVLIILAIIVFVISLFSRKK